MEKTEKGTIIRVGKCCFHISAGCPRSDEAHLRVRAAEKGKWSGRAQAPVVSNLAMEEVRKGWGPGGPSLARSYVTHRKLYFCKHQFDY